jgi:pyruvate dehydrogenase E1 component beta subunit
MPRRITYRDAVREALDEEIARDPMVVVMGEEVAQYNGAYKVTQGLWDKWGDKRLVDTPISEAGFIGMGIGASMLGVRPVMELMFWSFYTVAWDQIINNAGMVRSCLVVKSTAPSLSAVLPTAAPVWEPPTVIRQKTSWPASPG